MSHSTILSTNEGRLHGVNVRRLMARANMTLAEVVAATGLDERTVRSLIREEARPHPRTLHKLAEGLDVEVEELFREPARFVDPRFDRASNPAVTQAIQSYPEIFANWTEPEFDELYSRVAVGGELTEQGAVAAAEAMNRRRELLARAAVVLESEQGDLLREFIDLIYRRVTDYDASNDSS